MTHAFVRARLMGVRSFRVFWRKHTLERVVWEKEFGVGRCAGARLGAKIGSIDVWRVICAAFACGACVSSAADEPALGALAAASGGCAAFLLSLLALVEGLI